MDGLTAVSLFAGIEGFGLALERAGIQVKASVEIDPACRGAIALHFPETALFDDVTEVTGDQLRAAGFVPERGIITGGFPCQDLSVAGRRAGLGGARSGLFWHIVRLARELRPRWLLLENVPGLLSATCACPGDDTCTANGRAVECGRWEKRGEEQVWLANVPHAPPGGACPGGCMERHGGAMGTVLGALAGLGYGYAYRVLDAQFFGVPQRRERVFIVGCLGDRAAPVEILLESESGEGNPAAGGAARKGSAAASGGGAVSTLQGGGRRGYRVDAEGAAGGHLIAVPLALRGREEGARVELGPAGAPAFALRAASGGSSHAMIAYALTARNDRNDRNDREETYIVDSHRVPRISAEVRSEGHDASEDGTGRQALVPMAFNPQTGCGAARLGYGEKPTALSCTQTTAIHLPMAFAENQRGEVVETTYSHQLTTGGGKAGQGYAGVRTHAGVRRLTPKERERLQGFPDDWTRWRLEDGHLVEQSDAARDRQTGNAVAVPVVTWITRRIAAVEAASEARGAA